MIRNIKRSKSLCLSLKKYGFRTGQGHIRIWQIMRYPKQRILDCEIQQSVKIIPLTEWPTIKRSSSSPKVLRKWLATLKKQCAGCGETDIALLVFHHKNPKEKVLGVSEMASRHYAKETILAEIEKCVVLCWNCHMRIHVFDREEQKALNQEICKNVMV